MKRCQNVCLRRFVLPLFFCAATQVQAAPDDVTITFVELNDLHANLIGHKDLIRNADGSTRVGMRGGMARMKTVIDAIRSENPNTVLMNVGDTYHGGVEAFYSLGNAVSDPLNALGIDVGVPGNWDYYFTPAVTRARYGRINEDVDVVQATIPGLANPVPVKRPNFPNLGANVRDITDLLPQDFLPPTHMLEYSGVKVGFIGFTSDIVEMMHPMLAQGMNFSYGLEEHKDLLIQHSQDLRNQGADIVVVMSELGMQKDVALSKALAGMVADGELAAGLIDAFFSAHTHEATAVPVTTSNSGMALYAPVVEAGNDGFLGRMDVTMRYEGSTTTGRRRNQTTEENWSPTGMNWQLITIDESIAEDTSVKAMVDAERAIFLAEDTSLRAIPFFMQQLNQPIDTVIGHIGAGTVLNQNTALSGILTRNQSFTSTFNDALTEMMRDVTGTEIAMTPGFRMGANVPEAGFLMENGVVASGDITLEDAYRFFPMYYGLATATTTGAHLKGEIEDILKTVYSSDTWNHAGGWNYGYAGLDMVLDLSAGDGRRLLELRHASNGSLVADNEVLTITGCRRLPIDFSGVLCGRGGFSNVQDVQNPASILPWSLVDVFTQMLQDQSYVLTADGAGMTDISETQMWPAVEVRQPLEGVGTYNEPHDPTDPCGFFKWNCLGN